jgi:hypothetical protein
MDVYKKPIFSKNFIPFRSEPTHMRRNSAKVAHFSRNYEKRSESIPRNFDGNPTAKSIHSRGDLHVKQMFISLMAILRDRVKNTIFLDLLCVWIFWIQNSNLLEKGRCSMKRFFDLCILSGMTNFNFDIHLFSKIDFFTSVPLTSACSTCQREKV